MWRIEPLRGEPETVAALSELLIEAVESGASVSFRKPLSIDRASRFWASSLDAAARGERIVLGAFDRTALVGTVTLVWAPQENQAHRGEIQKMITRADVRGRGVGRALLTAAETVAADRGRWLLVLDTATVDGASAFYEKAGWRLAGEVPDYATTPDGQLSGTRIYWKRLPVDPNADTRPLTT